MHQKLPDTKQSFWDLSVIQLTGIISLPVLASSILVLKDNSFSNAIITVILGNLILWVIRYGIIAMSHTDRKSTLDIARDYMGPLGSYFISILLLVATLAWFVVQTTLGSNALTSLIQVGVGEGAGINRFIQTSAFLGIISTLLCMEGIIVLRWLSLISFPLLVIAFIIVLSTAPHGLPSPSNIPFSLAGLPIVLSTSLGITADLPTFFRHSKSWKTSIAGLATIQILSLVIGIGGLFLGSVIIPWFGIDSSAGYGNASTLLRMSLIGLIFISTICANVANVYSASVGWEIVAPAALVGRKEYLILGLGLTTVFILVSNVFSLDLLLNTTDDSLMNLCLVLFISYLISRLVKRPPTTFEKLIYFIAWLVATVCNILQDFNFLMSAYSTLQIGLAGILTTIGIGMIIQYLRKNRERIPKKE